ncbi:MAG: acyltransferase [Acidobacteria bacterium]|nr:acyltransferase [Acidobacteriota bacterium]
MPHIETSIQPSPAATTTDAHQTPRTQRDPALDGLRGLAVLMVFLFHYGGGLQSSSPAVRLMGYVTQGSWLGVVLFFALSGFLITGSLWDSVGQRHRLRNFYIRRILRIFPLYFLALAAAALYALHRHAPTSSLKPLLVFVFFLQDFPHLSSYAIQNQFTLPLYHLWTVAVEEQFYLLWPIVLLFAHSRRHAVRLSLWMFGTVELFLYCVYALPPFAGARTHHLYDYFLLTQAGPIALGAAVSLAMGSRIATTGRKPGSHRIIRKYARPAFLIGLAIYLYTSFLSKTLYLGDPIQFWIGLPAISVAAAAAIPLVLRPGLLRTLASNSALGWMGRISYGFYIFHILLEPLFDHIGRVVAHANTGEYYQIVRLVFAFPITCLISWLSFHLFELPILSLKRYFPMSSSLPWGEPLAHSPHSSRRKRSRTRHS